MKRTARDLNESQRSQVIAAVDTLLRAERDTGLSAKEMARIVANHRAASKRKRNFIRAAFDGGASITSTIPVRLTYSITKANR